MRRVVVGLICTFPLMAQSGSKPDFIRDIRPLLSDRCFACHGPDEHNRKANLRLDTQEGAAAVLKSGKFMARVGHEKKALRMPPPGAKDLNDAQIALLRRWIDSGSEWKTHWSFTTPVKNTLPSVQASWGKNEIDRFVLTQLEKEGLKPSPVADRATLLRRVTLDLTGLPPTIQELDSFLNDRSPNAYEKVVDRLLASPRYGERMAMPWLDLSRYADTHGFHIDSNRDMWPWRDWVVSAFNRNMPYNQFAVWQLAGDLLKNPSTEQLLATGFNRNHMINFEGGAIPEEYHVEYVVDRVETTANAFMGMTMGCARCHDHKYDPIRQKEFYEFFAFFNTVNEKGLDGSIGNARPMMPLPDRNQEKELASIHSRISELEAWMDERDIPSMREGWEQNQPVFPTAPAADEKGSSAASVRIRQSGRLDTVEATLIDQPSFKLWIDGGVAIGRNRRGSYLFLKQGDAIYRTQDYIITGSWQHIALNLEGTPQLWVNTKPLKLNRIQMAELPELFKRGTQEDLRLFSHNLTEKEIRILAVDEPARKALEVEPKKRTTEQRLLLLDYFFENSAPESVRSVNRELTALYEKQKELNYEIPTTMVMAEMALPRETKILARGDYRNGTEIVTPNVPSFLPPLSKDTPRNRLGLAQWLTSENHPLFSRVAVNRFWQMYFGTGIVKTVEDFGNQGELPSHPELLDWLAVDFRESGWDVKALQKKILMSATYQQQSNVSPALQEKDPENRLLARGPRFRLPAETIRDQALAASGLLNGKLGGPGVYPYQPSGVWEDIAYGDTFSAQVYQQSHGDALYRRSMYTYWKRTAPPPSLATFDAPDREKCIARRALTNTPLQALVLMNDPTYVEASRSLAARMMKEGGSDPIGWAFKNTLARKPEARERTILLNQWNKQIGVYQNYPKGVDELLSAGESKVPSGLNKTQLAAWTTVASVILNLDETVTKE